MTTTGRGDSAYDASYETLGDLSIDSSLGGGAITSYFCWLDLATAVSGIEFAAEGKIYRQENFASAPNHVLVTHLTCDHPGQINFRLKLSRVAIATTSSDGDVMLWVEGCAAPATHW